MFSAAAAMFTVISPIVIPLATTAIKNVGEWLAEYREQNIVDLTKIGEHYLESHRGLSDKTPFAEITFEFGSTNQAPEQEIVSNLSSAAKESLPIYLKMSAEKPNFPALYVLTSGKFTPCKTQRSWLNKLHDSPLHVEIDESLGYICEYQRARMTTRLLDRLTQEKQDEFSYDPVNLFFEEHKVWLLKLSYLPIDDKETLALAMARKNYLAAVKDDPRLFKKQDGDNIRAAIVDVINILEQRILPSINEAIARRSAREHFNTLKIQLKLSIKALFKFLYYGLRDNATTENFLLEELRQPTFEAYATKQHLVLEQILRYLAFTETVVGVFPPIIGRYTPYSGQFLLLGSAVNLPKLSDALAALNVRNFWQPGDKKIQTGILPAFCEDEANMQRFLRLCGYIQRLCLCHQIADEFYDLAGEGGNLLVYRLAASAIEPLLDELPKLFDKILIESQALHRLAEDHYNACKASRAKRKTTKQDQAWTEVYQLSKYAHADLTGSLDACKAAVGEMRKKFEVVNTQQYLDNIVRKVAHLDQLLRQFHGHTAAAAVSNAGATALTAPPQRLSLFSSAPQSSSAASETPVAINLTELNGVIESFMADGDFASAYELYQGYVEEAPNNDELKLAFVTFMLANGQSEHRQYALTLVSSIEKNAKYQADVNFLYIKATLLKRQGDLRPAEVVIKQILEIDANHSLAATLFQEVIAELADSSTKTMS